MVVWLVVVEIIICVYIGEVLGLFIQCENTHILYPIRWYSFLVPLVRPVILYSCLKESIEKKRMWLLKFFLFSGEINSIILCVFADLQPEIRDRRQKRKKHRMVEEMKRENDSLINIPLIIDPLVIDKCVFELRTFSE